MLYMKSESTSGNIQFINTECISGFKYDVASDVTIIYTTDNVKWITKGDFTKKILETLRKSNNLTVISLGE